MANQNKKNFVDGIVDTQKQIADAVIENTKKFANGSPIVNETVQKGADWYKNWLDSQKNIFNKSTNQTANMTNNMQENMSKMNEFYQNWFNTQATWAKQIWEMNTKYFQNATTDSTKGFNMDPMNTWNNMQNNWNSWMTGVNNTNQWMNMMQQWNNMFNMDTYKNAPENWTNIFNQYNEMLNTNWAKMQESMENGTTQDAYKNMVNATESFARFYEMWMPMWNSIQDKTFNMDVYKQWMNPVTYKELMDKYLGFMPETSRAYVQQMTTMMQDGMKQMGNMGTQNYQQMQHMMKNMFPAFNHSDMFNNMMNGYNQFSSMMTEATAPFTKMMTPGQHSKTMMEWQDITNRIAVYNIKNAELQYMMYTQGTKVMDKLAENVMEKIQNGTEISSIMSLFQEWMNLSDTTFVSLFETDEYSKLMAEVSAMQLKLRKDIDTQMEKFMTGIPVATRSEMDEVYKTIYDLKKQVRQLEKMLELDTTEVEETPAPKTTTARKTTTKK